MIHNSPDIKMLIKQNQVIFLDTTLRDGELTPGLQFDLNQKIEIAEQLESAGIDIIEAGYPGQYEKDYQHLVQLSQHLEKATLCALARCHQLEILQVVRSLENAPKARIHLYANVGLPASVRGNAILEEIAASVSFAKQYFDEVQWSAFDATRSDRNFLDQAISVALESGATTIGIPDSLGVLLPEEFGNFIQTISDDRLMDKPVMVSVHCHNDLGKAVENTIAALQCGARQVECTINGLGARKGNTDLEKILQFILAQNQLYTSISLPTIKKLSLLVSAFSYQPSAVS